MKNKAVVVSLTVCVICIAVMIGALIYSGSREPQIAVFVPPPFDTSALSGTPEVPEYLGWSEISQEGLGYTAYICGRPIAVGGKLTVYFTNPETNSVWLKLRVTDGSGSVIGESGLIRPGEYIQGVELDGDVSSGDAVKLKIMAYESETYHSAGAVSLNTTVNTE